MAVVLDGVLRGDADAHVSVFDRGLLYGDTVFETLRAQGGRLFALDEHLARLRASAALVRIPLTVTDEALTGEVQQALAALPAGADGLVRIVVTRGRGGLTRPLSQVGPSARIVFAEAVPPEGASWEGPGLVVVSATLTRPTQGTPAFAAKVGSYLATVLALDDARQKGAGDVLFVSADGLVLEAAFANAFAVVGGVLVTPPAGDGVLAGITRRWVLALAHEEGVAVAERPLRRDELEDAQEVFFTSSVRGLAPVARLDGRLLPPPPAPVTARLRAAYRRKARGDDPL